MQILKQVKISTVITNLPQFAYLSLKRVTKNARFNYYIMYYKIYDYLINNK